MALSRLMGIDYGEKRIGIALSDPLQIIASPFTVIPNNGSEAFSKINQLVVEENVNLIILGLPLNLAGEDTDKTREVRVFCEKLKNAVKVPVKLWDERYSSAEAKTALKQMGISSRDNKQHIDKIAASIILKDYMDNSQ
ncbi:MAG: Holliday junction resolvase RuvX [Candidatus Cloacimonas sp. 4484_143]|nr:MAG: Holliday junction resolvase RuvX [Candidatus Cloacimonas sp. 4484_143]